MIENLPANWDELFEAGAPSETRVIITRKDFEGTYTHEQIISATVKTSSCAHSLNVGDVTSKQATIVLLTDDVTTLSMLNAAKVKIYTRYKSGTTVSGWFLWGTYYVNSKKIEGKKITLECYDRMSRSVGRFAKNTDADKALFPMTIGDAYERACGQYGITASNITLGKATLLHPEYTINYTEDLTTKEVLSEIAKLQGGCFYQDYDGAVKFVCPLAPPTGVVISTAKQFKKYTQGTRGIIAAVKITDAAGTEIENKAADYDEEELLQLMNISLNVTTNTELSAIATDLYNKLVPSLALGYKAQALYFNPKYTVGDRLAVGGNVMAVCQLTAYLSGVIKFDISDPISSGSAQSKGEYTGATTTKTERTAERAQTTATTAMTAFPPAPIQYSFKKFTNIDADTGGGFELKSKDNTTSFSISENGIQLDRKNAANGYRASINANTYLSVNVVDKNGLGFSSANVYIAPTEIAVTSKSGNAQAKVSILNSGLISVYSGNDSTSCELALNSTHFYARYGSAFRLELNENGLYVNGKKVLTEE